MSAAAMRSRACFGRLIGRALPDGVVPVLVRCACRWEQCDEVDVNEPLARQLEGMSCLSCGRLGQMAVVRS